MKVLFTILAIMSILSQVPHAYWAIDKFNTIPIKWMRQAQNIIFCGIISVGILAFVLAGKHWFALCGAAVEVTINIYYYQTQFTNVDKRKAESKEKKWLAWFLAFLIPISIYCFSLEISGQ